MENTTQKWKSEIRSHLINARQPKTTRDQENQNPPRQTQINDRLRKYEPTILPNIEQFQQHPKLKMGKRIKQK